MNYHLQFGVVAEFISTLMDGLWLTMALSAVGIAGGFILGVAGAAMISSSRGVPAFALRCYVELFRNTPMLIQLLVLFFGLPSVGIRLSPLAAAMTALVLNNTAYVIEIVRSGIESTHKGQYEAATSLALTPYQALRYVIIPPALEKVFTPIISQSVMLMLSTSIVSTIGVSELTGAAMQISSDTFRALELYLFVALIYVMINYLLRLILHALKIVLFGRGINSGFFERFSHAFYQQKETVRRNKNA